MQNPDLMNERHQGGAGAREAAAGARPTGYEGGFGGFGGFVTFGALGFGGRSGEPMLSNRPRSSSRIAIAIRPAMSSGVLVGTAL